MGVYRTSIINIDNKLYRVVSIYKYILFPPYIRLKYICVPYPLKCLFNTIYAWYRVFFFVVCFNMVCWYWRQQLNIIDSDTKWSISEICKSTNPLNQMSCFTSPKGCKCRMQQPTPFDLDAADNHAFMGCLSQCKLKCATILIAHASLSR